MRETAAALSPVRAAGGVVDEQDLHSRALAFARHSFNADDPQLARVGLETGAQPAMTCGSSIS